MNLFRIQGIQLAMHVSFPLLLASYAWQGWLEGGWAGLVWELGFISLLFGCVVLHELGHSLTARRYGVWVPRILLTPIGGIAEFDRIPSQPRAELLITIAGPAVNFALTAILAPFFWTGLWSDTPIPSFGGEALGIYLLGANLFMGCFNLLPVFPMDGGRILRALLAMRQPYLQATWWAARIGQIAAILLAVTALYFDRWLTGLLFLFVVLLGGAEYRNVRRLHEEASRRAEMARLVHAELAGSDPASLPPPLQKPGE